MSGESGIVTNRDAISGNINTQDTISGNIEGGAVIENRDYEPLINKPQIEHNTLIGNKSFAELGLVALTEQDIDKIIFGG